MRLLHFVDRSPMGPKRQIIKYREQGEKQKSNKMSLSVFMGIACGLIRLSGAMAARVCVSGRSIAPGFSDSLSRSSVCELVGREPVRYLVIDVSTRLAFL